MFFYWATKIKLNTKDTINSPDLSKAVALKTFITEIESTKLEESLNRIKAKLDRATIIDSWVGIERWSQKEALYEWEEKENAQKQDWYYDSFN
jgi:hypothetical protein